MTAIDLNVLAEKLSRLPSERIAEVVDFVDFLAAREGERELSRVVSAASAPALAAVWSRADDDDYNEL